ncbi:MAG: DNA-binding domain-containing protein [Siculibacillus sp.]|nr:DNA-binding domain-containing protein [Siculibacillus sp.]
MRPDPFPDHGARQAAFAAALLDAGAPVPDGLLAPGGGPVGRRFAVHRATTTLGSIAALATRHPVLERLLGSETFADLARAFLRTNRPRTALLLDWGGGLPDFVATHPDLADWPWLADVARLEVAWNEAHHAAEAEPIELAELVAADPERVARSRLVLHPSLRLLASPWPVAGIWAANGEIEAVEARAEHMVVVRPHADVLVHPTDTAGFAFATALSAGGTILAAASAAAAIDPDFDTGAHLVGLVRLGAVVALEPVEEKDADA